MNRKKVKLAAGIVGLIGLTGVYAALKHYNQEQEIQQVQEMQGQEILSIDRSSVKEVEYTIDDLQISFVKVDDMWKKSDDETFPVDEDAILSPVSELASLKAVRILDDAEDSSEYGMDEPQKIIRLTQEDGTKTELVIGAANAGTGDDYMMLNDDTSVIYTISSTLRSSLSDDLYDYAVSEEIPYVQASAVTSLSVQKAEGSYELYLEDNEWKAAELVSLEDDILEEEQLTGEKMTEAEELTGYGEVVDADPELVNDTLADLSGLSYTDYAAHNCEDASAYGIDADQRVLTISWQEKTDLTEDEMETETENECETESAAGNEAEYETETEAEASVSYEQHSLVFFIGKTDESGNYYVQQKNSTEVHTISASILDPLFQTSVKDWKTAEASETESE